MVKQIKKLTLKIYKTIEKENILNKILVLDLKYEFNNIDIIKNETLFLKNIDNNISIDDIEKLLNTRIININKERSFINILKEIDKTKGVLKLMDNYSFYVKWE